MPESSDECPCEGVSPPGAPGSVEDCETVLRIVPIYDQLAFGEDGVPSLTSASFSQDELAGKSGKTVSVLREELTPSSEITRRCTALTKDEGWKSDPVVARASAADLRSIVNENSKREICVNADPTRAEDILGACSTHASLIRAITQDTKIPLRLAWGVLRATLASRFKDIRHASGISPVRRQ